MSIPYILVPNKMTGEGGYFARVKSYDVADLDVIADRMAARGTTVGRADIVAALQLLEEVCVDLVLEGRRVHLGDLVRIYCAIEGTFDAPDDRFYPNRHTLKGVAQAGPGLNQALQHKAQPRKQKTVLPCPNPRQFTDVGSGSHDRFTPGGLGRLSGSRLKVDPDADDEGVFVVDAAGQAHRLLVGHNTPRLLFFHLPQLPPDVYHLEVRARVGNASELRSGRLDQPLSVIESAS
jgi:hypothetical protein